MREKLEQPGTQAQWKQRCRIIEPRFAQLKQQDGFRRWTVWGLAGVRAQWSLLCATLNLRILYRRWQKAVRGGTTAARAVLGQVWSANPRRVQAAWIAPSFSRASAA
jgi:hypothetical protein